MGWLHAPLKIKVAGGDDTTESRVAQYGGDDLACAMPEVDQFIIEQWHKLGFNLNVGNGCYPLTWAEIDSFSNRLSAPLTEWESSQLIMMSREYCSWLIKAEDKYLEAPWHDKDYDPVVANRMRNAEKLKKVKAARNKI